MSELEHLRVAQHGGRGSSSPSPTPSSSPPGSSGYSPSESSDASLSPILNRSVRKASTHTPGVPRDGSNSSSSDEMNTSTDSNCQEFHMDTDNGTHNSLLHSATKPIVEMSSETSTSELVLDTTKLSLQECQGLVPGYKANQDQDHIKRIRKLEDEKRQLQARVKELEERERQPLAVRNENIITDSKKPPKGPKPTRQQHSANKENK